MADTVVQELGWHRVCLNTIVRQTKELDSSRLRILPMGSRVNVVDVVGRRVKIDQPIDGWCSIESSNGDLILSKISDEPVLVQGEEGKGVFETDQDFYNDRAKEVEEELKELQSLRLQLEEARNKTQEVAKNESLSAELNKEVADLESQAKEQERIRKEIQEKQDFLAKLNKNASKLGEMGEVAARQQRDVRQKTYKLISGDDNSDALPSKETSHDTHLLNGDVVMINQQMGLAIVRFVGEVHFSDQIMLGAELSDALGDNDGTKDDQTYFKCPKNHGVFFPLNEVKKKLPAEDLLQKLHLIVKKLNMSRSAVDGAA